MYLCLNYDLSTLYHYKDTSDSKLLPTCWPTNHSAHVFWLPADPGYSLDHMSTDYLLTLGTYWTILHICLLITCWSWVLTGPFYTCLLTTCWPLVLTGPFYTYVCWLPADPGYSLDHFTHVYWLTAESWELTGPFDMSTDYLPTLVWMSLTHSIYWGSIRAWGSIVNAFLLGYHHVKHTLHLYQLTLSELQLCLKHILTIVKMIITYMNPMICLANI